MSGQFAWEEQDSGQTTVREILYTGLDFTQAFSCIQCQTYISGPCQAEDTYTCKAPVHRK